MATIAAAVVLSQLLPLRIRRSQVCSLLDYYLVKFLMCRLDPSTSSTPVSSAPSQSSSVLVTASTFSSVQSSSSAVVVSSTAPTTSTSTSASASASASKSNTPSTTVSSSTTSSISQSTPSVLQQTVCTFFKYLHTLRYSNI